MDYIYILILIIQIEKNLTTILSHSKHNAKINDLIGTWQIKDKRMPVKQLTITTDDIRKAEEHEKHYLGCSACNLTPIGSVIVQTQHLIFRDNWLASKLKKYSKNTSYVYKLVLHPNGVVRFVINNRIPLLCKFFMIRSDSKGWFDMILNIIHSKRKGCFCLGILSPDTRTIQRYNRWNDKYPDQYYTMIKI